MNRAQIIVVFSILVLFGCEEEFDEARDRALLQKMEQAIETLAGEPVCQNTGSCRYIGMGAKPCGGPWKYLVYSVATVDSVTLSDRVRAYNEFNQRLNRRYGWVSDCSLTPVPTMGCRDGKCVNLGDHP